MRCIKIVHVKVQLFQLQDTSNYKFSGTTFKSPLLVSLATCLQCQILTVKLLEFPGPITRVAKQTTRLTPTRTCEHWNRFKCIWKNWWNFARSVPIRTALSNQIYCSVRALVTSLLLDDLVDRDTQESQHYSHSGSSVKLSYQLFVLVCPPVGC